MAVNVRREKNKLKIELPLERAVPSKSGKTLVVASTHGVLTTNVKYKRKPVSLVANAFIYPDQPSEPDSQRQRSRRLQFRSSPRWRSV